MNADLTTLVLALLGAIFMVLNVIFKFIDFHDKLIKLNGLINRLIFKQDLQSLFSESVKRPTYNKAQLIKEVMNYYNEAFEETSPALQIVDNLYLESCLSVHGNSKNSVRNCARFLCLYANEWCLSKNPAFSITVSYIDEESNQILSPRIEDIVKEYTGFSLLFDYFNSFRNESNKLFESETYDLTELEGYNPLNMCFSKGKYSKLINFNEAIARETKFISHRMAKLTRAGKTNYPHEKLSKKILTRILLSKSNYRLRNLYPVEHLLNYKEYPCSIGLNVFTVLKARSKYFTFIQRRPPTMAENPGMAHVLPAGTFQPHPAGSNKEWKKQCDFKYTVFRELIEEVFDIEFMQHPEKPSAIFSPDTLIPVKNKKTKDTVKYEIGELIPIQNDEIGDLVGDYILVPTSYSIDLLPIKPQLSFILYFESERLYDILCDCEIGTVSEGKMEICEIDSEEFVELIRDDLNEERFTQTGSIAFAEGYYYFKKHICPA